MNNRPTPETDAEAMQDEWDHVDTDFGPFAPSTMVSAEFARELERERDEAREKIKELIYIAERAIALAEIDFENDKFGVVTELRDTLMSIKMSTSK